MLSLRTKLAAERKIEIIFQFHPSVQQAVIAQLGERQTEDLKVPGSIPGRGIFSQIFCFIILELI